MPDPTAHADDMKSPAFIKPNEMPAFWWLNPWGYARNLKQALHAVDLLSQTTEDAYQAAKHVIKQKTELAELHKTERYDFLRKVEVTLEAAGGPKGYHDTIELVVWAADEIKRLRRTADEALQRVETEREETSSLRSQLEGKQSFINQALKDLEECQKHIEELTAEKKAKPLFEDKTAGLTFTFGNHEDRHSPLREEYAALGRKFIKARVKAIAKAKKTTAKAKAKKKGGAK